MLRRDRVGWKRCGVSVIVAMTTITFWSHRCRTNVLFAAILVLGAYALVFDKHDDVTGRTVGDLVTVNTVTTLNLELH